MKTHHLVDVEHLKSLDGAALKAAWRAVFKSAPPRAAHKEFFIRFLAHEFQVRVNGGLRESSLKALDEFVRAGNSSAMLAAAAVLKRWQLNTSTSATTAATNWKLPAQNTVRVSSSNPGRR